MSKAILITGGSSGIGHAMAKKLLALGHTVVIVSRHATQCDLAADTKHCLAYDIDLTSPESFSDFIKRLDSEHGIKVIDILINSGGVAYGTPLKNLSENDYDQIMDTNLKGLIFMTKTVVPNMPKGGVICNISSIAGIRGFTEWGVYCASKFAVEGFTKALRDEVRAQGIKVMAVRPGSVDTAIYSALSHDEKKDFIQPETIADIVIQNLFLEPNACTEELFINNSVGDL